MLTIFLWIVDDFCGQILRFLQKNLTIFEENVMSFARKRPIFAEKFDNVKFILMWSKVYF